MAVYKIVGRNVYHRRMDCGALKRVNLPEWNIVTTYRILPEWTQCRRCMHDPIPLREGYARK